jgi:pilus assembly protein CpaE
MTPDTSPPRPSILLIGPDAALLKSVETALSQSRAVSVSAIVEPVEQAGKRPEIDGAAVLVIALDSKRRESLIALQGLVNRLAGRIPVVVLTDAFDDALARWFLQIKVTDFLRKPVEPKEVLRACLRAMRVSRGGRGMEPTCLVDLDFQGAACADYLDLDPRLDLEEIGTNPERLDLQLLDVMLARHSSGLSVLSARGRPGERCTLDPEVVIRLLDLVSSRFENVVIDMSRVWEPWTDQVLLGSNRVYVVTDMTVPGLRLGRRMAGALSQRLPEVKPRVIVNRFEQQLFGTGLRRADVERALDGFFEGTVTNNYKLVREAIDRGTTLDQIKAGNVVSNDLKKIVFAQIAAE